ncbi:hypothetical protein NDA11_004240 [Ustilago hordei]|nr:hypothetical protein NDA10_004669 [Ustilago hordei]KAJ1570458.1 hypothetical protein NDA15_006620 [Ustilago hordei]KAJ1571727.1 hypothetical protein NDA12_000941 [Ustilago hordei]KAJ1575962.1 hypothetical protein NDA11_004240 [Ustilago hordei]KAJ1604123.1 hypothetical protein NDA14_001746 [Ustilago hordei]
MSAAFNPVSLLAERTCAPIYNAIDTGNSSLAIRHADKILASQPDLALASALKALALVRSGKRNEANQVCARLVTRGLRKGEENVLTPLTWTLVRLGRRTDELALLETAVKDSPNNQDLARQTFFALTKAQSFQKAQQLALKMHKSFSARKQGRGRFADEYFWWSILSYLLLARDANAPGAALALPLSQRMIEKQIETKPLGLNDEEALCLLLQVLIRQGNKKDAFDLIANQASVGYTLCDRNLGLEFTRTDLAKDLQDWQYVEQNSWSRIQGGSRNWAHFTAFLDAAEKLGKEHITEAQKKINVLLSSKGAVKDRSVRLAELQVIRKRIALGEEVEALLLNKMVAYLDTFASKACCHEDLLPYLGLLSTTSRATLTEASKGKSKPLPVQSELDLRTNISIAKITRTIQPASTRTEASEAAIATSLLKQYHDGLSIASCLPETEMQPADELALLGSQALLSCYRLSHGKLSYLHQTIALLEHALTKSQKGYQLRMLLIRTYILSAAYERASIHYNLLGLKSVQSDTLSHLISDRVSCFSASTTNDDLYKLTLRTLSTSQAIYEENSTSTPEMIAKALEHGIYSRVEEFVEFGEALDRSLQRQVVQLEEARSHLQSRANWKDLERRSKFERRIESVVKAVREGVSAGLRDQRDWDVLVNYQPEGSASVEELVQVGPRVDVGWVKCIAFALSAGENGGIDEVKEEDKAKLTAAEKKLVEVVQSARSGSFQGAMLVEMLESTKSTVRAVVNVADGKTDASRTARPVDAVHQVGLALEAIYHTQAQLDEQTKTTCSTHLAEIATLVNHLSRSSSDGKLEQNEVLEQALSSLGKEKVHQMVEASRQTVVRSWTKMFSNLGDALRDAL